ncbi:uncharacterized protein TNCV_4116912 [Trichonephila clavipes]|nr:uncharacterized protein TNCV_4116912 [Trichonephila clavipes]
MRIETFTLVCKALPPHTITSAVGATCRCKAKARLRRSPRDLHTRTRLSSLLRLNLDSSLKTTWFHSAAVLFPRARHHSKRRRRWLGVKGSKCNGHRDPKCPSARRLRMVRKDTGAPNEGATCAWMAADEVVGCTRAFLTMWRSSRRLVCQGHPESGLRVNDISRIHWSQHLTTQSERPRALIETVCPDSWTWKEKVKGAKLAGFSGIENVQKFMQAEERGSTAIGRRGSVRKHSIGCPGVVHSNKLWLSVLYSMENDVKCPLPVIRYAESRCISNHLHISPKERDMCLHAKFR